MPALLCLSQHHRYVVRPTRQEHTWLVRSTEQRTGCPLSEQKAGSTSGIGLFLFIGTYACFNSGHWYLRVYGRDISRPYVHWQENGNVRLKHALRKGSWRGKVGMTEQKIYGRAA